MLRAVLLVAVTALLSSARCSPLQVTSASGATGSAPTALYRAPSTYREPGRPARNSVIITSQPVRIGQQLDLGGPPEGPAPAPAAPATPATWRRQLFVRTTLGTDGVAGMPSIHVTSSSTALGVGGTVAGTVGGGVAGGVSDAGGTGATPVVSIDCADGKSCSTTIPVRPPAATHSPTFKPYSQEVLDKFLSDYATVTTAGNGSDPAASGKELLLQLQQQQQQQQQRQQQHGDAASLQAAPDGEGEIEPTNRLANLYLEDSAEGADNSTEDKSKSVQWSLLKSQHHKHPYDDHKGWVTLEPVPWSSSHVSKWQSNVQPGRPWDNSPSPSSWHNDIDQRPGGAGPGPGSYAPPHHGPNSGYHHNQNTQNFNGNGNGNGNWPSGGGGGGGGPPRPSWGSLDGPSPSQWDQDRPGASQQDYRPERPSRPSSWESGRPNKWERPSQPDQWVSSADPDIITDNSPPDFPAHPGQHGHPAQQGSRPGGSYSYGPGPSTSGRPWGGDRPHREPGRHPPTHPEEGDGTWVLLSSTKGYSTPPRGRLPHQRALTVSTHRSVRLTVLPPENGTNMTTSHGGLLEVEDTQHTVDESQRLHAASLLKHALDQHHNATLSSYETLVREATRVHEAQLLKQALEDRRLANATALSPELLHLKQQQQADKRVDKRADNSTASTVPAATASRAKTKTSKSRTKIKIEPMPAPLRQHPADDAAGFTGRGEGSAMAVKVMRPNTPSRRSMALAAVGAGLLPATMAMLVPIMLGRRRRSAGEDVDADPYSGHAKSVQGTLQGTAFDQPLEVEDSPPRVFDVASLPSSAPSAWPRRRRNILQQLSRI